MQALPIAKANAMQGLVEFPPDLRDPVLTEQDFELIVRLERKRITDLIQPAILRYRCTGAKQVVEFYVLEGYRHGNIGAGRLRLIEELSKRFHDFRVLVEKTYGSETVTRWERWAEHSDISYLVYRQFRLSIQ